MVEEEVSFLEKFALMIQVGNCTTLVPPSSQLNLIVRVLPIQDLNEELIRAWNDLGERQLHANAFYQPQFLIPLCQQTRFATQPELLLISDQSEGLYGMTIMQRHNFSSKLPFPHVDSIQHNYLFSGDMLIDREHRDEVVRTMFNWLSSGRYRHGLCIQETTHMKSAPSLKPLMAREMGIQRFLERTWERAAVIPELSITEFLNAHSSKSRRKSINRSYKKLSQAGPVSFSFVHSKEVSHRQIENFLKLESMGWKGEAKTAIASNAADTSFFYAMCEQMSAAGKLVFGELKVGSEVIASTCNLIDKYVMFAFKIGWNPEYTAGSPGIWSELELMQAVRDELPQIRLIDSCAQPGSHLDDIWPERITCTKSFYVQSRRSKLIHHTRRVVRGFRNHVLR